MVHVHGDGGGGGGRGGMHLRPYKRQYYALIQA